MSRFRGKIIFAVAVIFIGILSIFIFFLNFKEKNLEVDFLDVGQGDAILIKSPFGQNILIDGGPDKSVVNKISEDLPFWDRNIDLMILTHPHDDHVTGLIEVLKRYRVKKIIYTGASHTAPNYLAWLDEIKKRKIPLTIINHPQNIKLGDNCEFKIIYPLKSFAGESVENLNNTSLVAKLIFGQTSFLLVGDAEKEAEEEIIKSGVELTANILKVGHHGSDTASSDIFLNNVRPQIAVIEVGKDNKFGLPSGRAIKRLERIGAKIYRTDYDGNIKLISDGMNIIKK